MTRRCDVRAGLLRAERWRMRRLAAAPQAGARLNRRGFRVECSFGNATSLLRGNEGRNKTMRRGNMSQLRIVLQPMDGDKRASPSSSACDGHCRRSPGCPTVYHGLLPVFSTVEIGRCELVKAGGTEDVHALDTAANSSGRPGPLPAPRFSGGGVASACR